MYFHGNPPHHYFGVLSDFITRSCFGVHSCLERSCRLGIGTDHPISESHASAVNIGGSKHGDRIWNNNRLQLNDHEFYQLDRYQLTNIDEIMKAIYDTEMMIKRKIPEFKSLVEEDLPKIERQIKDERSKLEFANIMNEYLDAKHESKFKERIERSKTVTILEDYIHSDAHA